MRVLTERFRVPINVAVYQLGWFTCVLSAARGRAAVGIVIAALIVAGWLLVAPRPAALWQLMALTGVVGYSWDSWVSVAGLIRYSPAAGPSPLAPLWMLALWLLFSTTLHVSLRWLQPKLLLAALLGAVVAPVAFYVAHVLGAVDLPRMLPALGAQAAGWALLLPLLLRLASRLNA